MKQCFCGGKTTSSPFLDGFAHEPLGRCLVCGSLGVATTPTDETLAAFYSGAYSDERESHVGEPYFEVMRRRAAAQRRMIGQHLALSAAHVLDYGCGYGMLLDALQNAGAQTEGFEHDPRCVNFAAERGHQLAPEDPLNAREPGEWDLICLSHVLEHLPEPVTFLERAMALAPRVFIEVPRYDWRIAEQFENQEGHLWFFTEEGVSSVVRAAGLEIEAIRTVGPASGLFWRSNQPWSMGRRMLRRVKGDWFFDAYDSERSDGLWIRVMAKRTLS